VTDQHLPAEPEQRPTEPLPPHPTKRGMFGIEGTGDVSGYGRLVRRITNPMVLDASAHWKQQALRSTMRSSASLSTVVKSPSS
jgi:hypothetical protein